jgi:hypothetical protein
MSSSQQVVEGKVIPPGAIPAKNGGWLKPIQKGESGNPGGWNKTEYHAVRRLCADRSLAAAQHLIDLMTDTDSRVAIVAIKEVLDRGIGKPRDHSNEQGGKIDLSALSADERNAMVELLKKAMGLE